ncbi:TonB-dependent receptor [Algibacter amylolyticus]|uniref:TonB-dependent receptor n=1 Tax=Algibacter amylolyticus TaxID=1608400 RepID=A0A5M7B454_9FLAO|nr:outer membrane beta-barrel family protein [Algibacter amylolyticus]KAA5823590.1 TonB-dependent receptor [Algibacter amylolyticus]MBB5267748.1 outer membrane receptor protein involved in Fe transport [Algibacter amylolyticus]TSJ74078.1 TonB-dependent receptor [Algibacter amylolyticus]
MLKNITFVLFTLFSLNLASAQVIITGKVLESNANLPIEYATISVIDTNSKTPLTGTITAEDGTFSLKTNETNFYIEVSFMGYESKTIKQFDIVKNTINLKIITLSEDNQALDEVVIRAEKSSTEFKLDKRVFNVGADLSSTGASSLEVLNNLPSVNVNIEGEISLRGSQGVQILINGKPSVLASADGNALGSITADMIEKIEVITNPSAKYDAEGTSGIINIIIKKSEKRGINGSATLNFGVPNSNSFGLSVNKRTEKFNLFSQFGFGIRTYPNKTESINRDLVNDITVSSTGDGDFNEKFGNILIGTDYHINDYNIITLSGSYAYEIEDQDSKTNYNQTDETNTITDSWLRNELTEADNPKLRYELQYKKSFKRHADQSLLFSALGNSFRKDQFSDFENTFTLGDNEDFKQKTRTDYTLADYTFKLDYTHPFLEKFTLETGSQYVINSVSNDFAVSDLQDGTYVNNPDLTNVFDFDQNVLGLYTTAAYEGDVWGLKLGFRLEHTNLSTLLQTTNESNGNDYTNLFPSIHTSYKISDDFSIQAGYSKRIRRPGLRELNPFSNIRNNFSIFTGNPDLQPEFTDSYEITSINKLGKASLNFSLYNRYTVDVVERISTFENNVSISTPENVGTNTTTGFEANGKYAPTNWFSFNGDFNINYFSRKGVFEATDFDFKGNQWSASLTTKFKLPADFDLEVSGDYQSKFKTVQSEIADNLFADLGLRKKILKGKVILNLSIRDAFASRINKTTTSQSDFYLFNSRQRGRFVTFGVSYGFGKGEAMQFSGQR